MQRSIDAIIISMTIPRTLSLTNLATCFGWLLVKRIMTDCMRANAFTDQAVTNCLYRLALTDELNTCVA